MAREYLLVIARALVFSVIYGIWSAVTGLEFTQGWLWVMAILFMIVAEFFEVLLGLSEPEEEPHD